MDERPFVMIVDQTKENREALHEILSKEYKLLEASNEDTAKQLLRENSKIKLIVVAVFLPNIAGFDLIEQLQRDDSLQRIPLMAAILAGDEGSELRALQLGITDFIAYPYNESLLRLKISKLLQRCEKPQLANASALEACESLALRDTLTGLFTREEFAGTTASLLKANKETEYLLLYFDID